MSDPPSDATVAPVALAARELRRRTHRFWILAFGIAFVVALVGALIFRRHAGRLRGMFFLVFVPSLGLAALLLRDRRRRWLAELAVAHGVSPAEIEAIAID